RGARSERREHRRQRLVLLDTQPEHLRITEHEDLVFARRTKILTTKALSSDAHIGHGIVPEAKARSSTWHEPHTELRICFEDVEVGKCAVVSRAESHLRDPESSDDAEAGSECSAAPA